MVPSSHESIALLGLASVQFAYWLVWGATLALSIALVALMWTRWGHSRPLQKCAALSLLVHLVMAFLAMTVRIVAGDGTGGGGGGGGGAPIHVRIVQELGSVNKTANFTSEKSPDIAPPELLAAPKPAEKAADVESPTMAKMERQQASALAPVGSPVELKRTDHEKDHAPIVVKNSAEPKAAAAKKSEHPRTSTSASTAASAMTSNSATNDKSSASNRQQTNTPVPPSAVAGNPYALRGASDRLSLIQGQGGNAKTEHAVVAALSWLAAAQSRDGRWIANQYGAGNEQKVLGQDRGGAGRNADTGITALAVLAFLGAGHSHVQGEYRDTVHRGIDFLLRSQAADGSIFGDATLYAQMYCHSMATFAIAEAEAMSGDRRLDRAVVNAVNYSLAAQDSRTGGWRYRPGDTGDTSQLGWQIMSLTSAKRAGIELPDQTWNRVDRFLRSVSRGNFGGLASYRPDSPASTSMTAEALYCRLMLQDANGVILDSTAANEATNQLIENLPTAEQPNLYYWYYATLALHHRQQTSDAAEKSWRQWNDALTTALLESQVADGSDAGSWNTDLWGGYGGRVYTTAMASMCLEVYYRYAAAPNSNERTATRPDWQPAPK